MVALLRLGIVEIERDGVVYPLNGRKVSSLSLGIVGRVLENVGEIEV